MMKGEKIKKIVAICAIGLLIVKMFFYDFVTLSGDSMENNFHDEEVVLIEKQFENLERFDVVICDTGRTGMESKIIKRIIALPGETIQIREGCVFINGEKLEDAITTKMDYAGIAENEIVLSANQYFLLGDNRNGSVDSRFEQLGVVSENQILGRVMLKIIEK